MALYGATGIWSGNIPYHLFKGKSVTLIHSEEKAREHKGNHQEHGPGIANGGTGEQVGGYADYRRRSEA